MAFCIFLSLKAGLDVINVDKVVLWVMQWQGYLVTEQKAEFFFTLHCFCSKADFRSANLTSEVFFFSMSLWTSSANASELTE